MPAGTRRMPRSARKCFASSRPGQAGLNVSVGDVVTNGAGGQLTCVECRVKALWKRRRPIRHVTLYGKPGCHLCEDARTLLLALADRYPIDLHEVDICGDAALFRAYDVRIPVIVVDGAMTLEAPIGERDLIRALR
jgi:glutaredoxin